MSVDFLQRNGGLKCCPWKCAALAAGLLCWCLEPALCVCVRACVRARVRARACVRACVDCLTTSCSQQPLLCKLLMCGPLQVSCDTDMYVMVGTVCLYFAVMCTTVDTTTLWRYHLSILPEWDKFIFWVVNAVASDWVANPGSSSAIKGYVLHLIPPVFLLQCPRTTP